MKTNCIKYIGVAILLATATMTFAKGGVIYTGELAKHVKGYSGPTPLKITVEKGRITKLKPKPVRNRQDTIEWHKRRFFLNTLGKPWMRPSISNQMVQQVLPTHLKPLLRTLK